MKKYNHKFIMAIHELCSPEFFNYLISDDEIEEIYKSFKNLNLPASTSYIDVRDAIYDIMLDLGYNF